MPAFDFPAFGRGISGLSTAKEEGKRFAEDRAREQQSRAVDDLFRRQSAQSLAERGRIARERLALQKQQAEERKAQREAVETQTASRNAADEDEILGQLNEPFDRTGKSHLFVMREARRRITEQNRVPRAGRKPPRDPEEVKAEEREKAIISERGRILRDDPELSESEAIEKATRRIDEQKFLLESQGFMQRLNEGGGSAIHLGGEKKTQPSTSDIEQMIRDRAARGLSPEEIQADLAQQGINVRL